MFKLAGSVIVFGVVGAYIIGLIRYTFKILCLKGGASMRLTGKQTWVFQNDIYVNATGTAVIRKKLRALLGKNLIFHMMTCIVEKKIGSSPNED